MSQPPPPRLEYQSPGYRRPPRPPDRYAVAKFLGGFGGGIVVSAVTWPLLFRSQTRLPEVAIYIVPAFKIIVGLGYLFVPRWRLVGGGVLASLAVGALIFFFSCAAN